ncbi:MAG: hypothetical protein WD048_11910 [Chitinophagales bacterium]
MRYVLNFLLYIHTSPKVQLFWIVIYWIISHGIKLGLIFVILRSKNYSDIIGLGAMGLFAWLIYHDIRVTQIGRRILKKIRQG